MLYAQPLSVAVVQPTIVLLAFIPLHVLEIEKSSGQGTAQPGPVIGTPGQISST